MTKPIEAWEAVAEKINEKRRAGQIENVAHVHSIFEEEKDFFLKMHNLTLNSSRLPVVIINSLHFFFF